MPDSIMKIICALALVIGAGSYFPGQASASASEPGPSDLKEMEAFVDGMMADQMSTNHIPGAVVSLVKDGKLVFAKGYGYADYETRLPVDPELSLFRMGSVSKLFVWTAVMQLVEQGKLSLDADINTYLDYKIPDTFPQPITLQHLMSHTAGFEDRGYKSYRLSLDELIPFETFVKTRLPARVYPPGKIIAYSNYGATLAGYIVQRVSGMPFPEYIEKNIFTPLGMDHSTFRQPLPASLAPGMSYGYNFYQEQTLKAGFEYVQFSPAAAMTSTAADIANFMLAQLGDGQLGANRILSERSAQLMHSELFSMDPRLPGMAYGFMENNLNGHRILFHSGNTSFFSSGLYLIPDQNLGIFVAANSPGGSITRTMLIENFMNHYYPVSPAQAPTPTASFASQAAPYRGTYYAARMNYSGPEKTPGTMQAGTLSLDARGGLTFSLSGKTFHFVETEPGLLQDIYDPDIQAVLQTDETGQSYLVFTGPNFAYIKVPWYGNINFINLLFIFGLTLFSAIITIWGTAAFKWLRKRLSRPGPARDSIFSLAARLAATSFGTIAIFGFITLNIGLTTVDPNLGVPAYEFGEQPLFGLLPFLSYLLFGLGLLVLVFCGLAWARRLWTLGGRLQYSVLALSALSLMWIFWYWNLDKPLT